MEENLKSDLRRLTLKQLRALSAVVRTGTVSGAAAALNVTPPAVTQQMRLLEETAGLPLTERTGDGLRATDAGKQVLVAAKRIEAAIEECGEALEALRGVEGGHVSIGVVSTAKYVIPRALAAFSREHPKVKLRLAVGNREETIAALENYELDIAVTGRPPDHFAVDKEAVGDHPHLIVAPPDHPLAGKRRIAIAELAPESFLLREQGSGTRALMQRLFAAEGLDPSLGMEIGSNETIKQAVMAGLGIALLSAHTVAVEIRDRRLVALDVVGLPVVRRWFVVKRREKDLLPAARALWEFLATEGKSFLPELPAG